MTDSPTKSADTSETPPATQLGRYRIEKKIGVGGMAEIYLASLASDRNALFAIKRILPSFANDQALVAMLINEAKVNVSLRHPNIVSVYDFGRVEDSYYLAMEFVSGFDVKSLITVCRRQGVWIPVKMALYILLEVLEGLSYAHRRRDNFNRPLEIVHRDVSPHNVMVSNQGEVKILDFGIAKVRGRASQTQTGMLKGKFSYMSPEQAAGLKVDRRTDVFSAGILLYELLTLENPFLQDQDMRTLELIKKAQYRSPRLLNQEIPKSVEKIVERALQKRPGKRFQSAEQFQAELFRIQREEVGFSSTAELKSFVATLMHGASEEEPTEYEGQAPVRQYQFAREEPTSDFDFVSRRWRRRGVFLVGMLAGAVCAAYITIYATQQRQMWLPGLRHRLQGLLSWIQPATKVNAKVVEQVTNLWIPDTDTLSVVFKGEAQAYMSSLPFDRFELLRNRITDQLLIQIRRQAQATKPPGMRIDKTHAMTIDDYKVVFSFSDDLLAVEIASLKRRGRS